VAEACVKTVPVPVETVGTDDRFGQVGTEDFLRREYALTAERIAEAAKKAIERK
jgi:transketolase